MSSCIDRDVLDAFAMGTLGEVAAVRVATHIDECPSCAAYAATADPMATVFAALDDPHVPNDLARSILDTYEQQTAAVAKREVWWAGILIGLSVALLPGIWRLDALSDSLGVLAHAAQKAAGIAMAASLPYAALVVAAVVLVSLFTGAPTLSARVRSPR